MLPLPSLDTHGSYDHITNAEDDDDMDDPAWRGGAATLWRGSGGATTLRRAMRGSFMLVTIPPKRYEKVSSHKTEWRKCLFYVIL